MGAVHHQAVVSELSSLRISRVCGSRLARDRLLRRLLGVAVRGLPLMRYDKHGQFGFSRRVGGDFRCSLVGVSDRYGAIAVIGASHATPDLQRSIFGGESAQEVCGQLIERQTADTDLGDAALVTWAAVNCGHPGVTRMVELLRVRNADSCPTQTVTAAWILIALSAVQSTIDLRIEARRARDRLNACFSLRAGVFAHYTADSISAWWRSHVACFADQVYPIQALARYHRVFGDKEALAVAARCATRICQLQGSAGQWWWHYDTRTGSVIEEYPVYTVHQDAMAPMALFDLMEAGGPDFTTSIARGLDWMGEHPETRQELIDDHHDLIWRSVRRKGLPRMVRRLRAGVSRWLPRVRTDRLAACWPPGAVDYEDRPYHLGWILEAWLGGRE